MPETMPPFAVATALDRQEKRHTRRNMLRILLEAYATPGHFLTGGIIAAVVRDLVGNDRHVASELVFLQELGLSPPAIASPPWAMPWPSERSICRRSCNKLLRRRKASLLARRLHPIPCRHEATRQGPKGSGQCVLTTCPAPPKTIGLLPAVIEVVPTPSSARPWKKEGTIMAKRASKVSPPDLALTELTVTLRGTASDIDIFIAAGAVAVNAALVHPLSREKLANLVGKKLPANSSDVSFILPIT